MRLVIDKASPNEKSSRAVAGGTAASLVVAPLRNAYIAERVHGIA
jgi:hypothetical protein